MQVFPLPLAFAHSEFHLREAALQGLALATPTPGGRTSRTSF